MVVLKSPYGFIGIRAKVTTNIFPIDDVSK